MNTTTILRMTLQTESGATIEITKGETGNFHISIAEDIVTLSPDEIIKVTNFINYTARI